MKFQYLGTAAAEGFPNPFCRCETCNLARQRGGREIRSRSQAIIDDKLLLDLPCDTYYHAIRHGIDLSTVRDCLITHVHEDHFYPTELMFTCDGYTHVPKDWPPLTIHGSEDVCELGKPSVEASNGATELHYLPPFTPTEIACYTVTALKARHGTAHPYLYLIEKDEKAILYAHDTGLFLDETWEFLIARKPNIVFASFDCTEGAWEEIGYDAHMCLGRAEKTAKRLRELGMLSDSATLVLNHFSHNGKDVNYAEMSEIAEKRGFLVSYDGMILNI